MNDVEVTNCGTVFTLLPLTPRAQEWFEANVHAEPWQWMGPALVVEHRFAGELVNGMVADGLEVR